MAASTIIPHSLTEDNIDDVLYFARANEATELSEMVTTLATVSSAKEDRKVVESEVLLAAVDPETKNTALHYAAANGHIDIVKYIIASLSSTTPELASLLPANTTPLQALLNFKNSAGNTALHWSALNGHTEIVSTLLAAGADVTILNEAGHDAVFEAELADKNDVVDVLLKNGIGLDEVIKGCGEGDGGEDSDEEEDETGEKGEKIGETVTREENGLERREDDKQEDRMEE